MLLKSFSVVEMLISTWALNFVQSSDSGTYSPPKQDGRLIYYHVADDYGGVDDGVEGNSFTFKGHSVKELTQKLEEETGLEDILVCTRSPLNAKLYPLRLQLPPNNTTMHIVVVPSTSRRMFIFSISFNTYPGYVLCLMHSCLPLIKF